jgi:hypothetical protein
MNEREKLWVDVYVAFIRSGNCAAEGINAYAQSIARKAVKDFDLWRAKEGKDDTQNDIG